MTTEERIERTCNEIKRAIIATSDDAEHRMRLVMSAKDHRHGRDETAAFFVGLLAGSIITALVAAIACACF
jgi:hypothetical protein